MSARYVVSTVLSRDSDTGFRVSAAWDRRLDRAIAIKQSPRAGREIGNLRRVRDAACDRGLIQRLEADDLIPACEIEGGDPDHPGIAVELLGAPADPPACSTDADVGLLAPYFRAVAELHRKSGLGHGRLGFGSFLAPLSQLTDSDDPRPAGPVLTGLSGASADSKDADARALGGMIEEAYGPSLGEAPFARAAAGMLKANRISAARFLRVLDSSQTL